jgi:hypothetical protein
VLTAKQLRIQRASFALLIDIVLLPIPCFVHRVVVKPLAFRDRTLVETRKNLKVATLFTYGLREQNKGNVLEKIITGPHFFIST